MGSGHRATGSIGRTVGSGSLGSERGASSGSNGGLAGIRDRASGTGMASTTGLARTTCAREIVTTRKSVISRGIFTAHIAQHQPMARDTHAGRLGGDRDIGQGAVAPVRQGSRAQGGKGQAAGTDRKRKEKHRVGWFCRDLKTETNQPAHSCAADEVPPGRAMGRGHQGAGRWTRSPAAIVRDAW